jgi:6-phosphogluconolactonase
MKRLLLLMMVALSARAAEFVWFGTYTGPASKGIYISKFDSKTGRLSTPTLAAESPNPSFLAVHPNGRFLYAVAEKDSGKVRAFAIDSSSGRLTFLNEVSSRGGGPCHLTVDPSGKNVLVANYGSGSIAVLPIGADGRLREASAFVQHTGSSVNKERQQGPHAHWIGTSPDNRFVLAVDLGLDRIFVYRFDPVAGSLTRHDPAYAAVHPGAGPRHFSFDRSWRFGYVLNELDSTVTAFGWDAGRGVLSEMATVSTLPKGYAGSNSGAELEAAAEGWLYASNRGHDSVAVFSIVRGVLSAGARVSTQGKTPRGFALSPDGGWLLAANQKSDSVVVFRVSGGGLAPAGQVVRVPSPVCVQFAAETK